MNIGQSWILLGRVGISEQFRCPIGSRPRSIYGSSPPAYRPGGYFRCVCRTGKCWGVGVTERVVWHVAKNYAKKTGPDQVAPHDLRRSCAKLCHTAGGELEQIQFLLGHVSVQTTERYLGCKQLQIPELPARIDLMPIPKRTTNRSPALSRLLLLESPERPIPKLSLTRTLKLNK